MIGHTPVPLIEFGGFGFCSFCVDFGPVDGMQVPSFHHRPDEALEQSPGSHSVITLHSKKLVFREQQVLCTMLLAARLTPEIFLSHSARLSRLCGTRDQNLGNELG